MYNAPIPSMEIGAFVVCRNLGRWHNRSAQSQLVYQHVNKEGLQAISRMKNVLLFQFCSSAPTSPV
jgi:hypothetical protein